MGLERFQPAIDGFSYPAEPARRLSRALLWRGQIRAPPPKIGRLDTAGAHRSGSLLPQASRSGARWQLYPRGHTVEKVRPALMAPMVTIRVTAIAPSRPARTGSGPG